MKKLFLFLLLSASLFACKKPGYSPCECANPLSVDPNQTVIPGLYFGSSWDEVSASGVFDTLIHFDNDHLTMPFCYGGLPSNISLGFDPQRGLSEVWIQFPYDRVSEDSLDFYLNVWHECINAIYGDGCFQRFKIEGGWSKEGLWQWDICGGPMATLWGSVENYWRFRR